MDLQGLLYLVVELLVRLQRNDYEFGPVGAWVGHLDLTMKRSRRAPVSLWKRCKMKKIRVHFEHGESRALCEARE